MKTHLILQSSQTYIHSYCNTSQPKRQILNTMASSSCSSTSLLSLLIFLLTLQSLVSPLSTNQHAKPNTMNSTELETLFKIMESMSSDQNWRISYPTPCNPGSSWPGIECKTGNENLFHVTRLDFGTPPNPTCKNTATFPSLIFQLPFLQSVFFFHCFTKTKTAISLPKNKLSFSSSLQQLSLRSNPALVGSIPPDISSLNSLQILTLSQNRLSGQIPSQIFTLTSLIHLDLSYNLLIGIIATHLGNLKNLVGLDLSYNSLAGSIPNTIGELGVLQKVDFSSNLLVGVIPDSIVRISSLVFIALSNNRLRGSFPKGLKKLQNLQYFIMDDNRMFTTLPPELGLLPKLQELRLANSGYSGIIPPSFSQLKNLSTLSLQNNRLSGEIPIGLGSLSHIYHLNLSRNFLVGVVPFNSSFLKRLAANLDLRGNPGLCLNPSEEYSVKIGVDICGKKNSASQLQALKKSEASFGFCKSFLILGVFVFISLHHIFVLSMN